MKSDNITWGFSIEHSGHDPEGVHILEWTPIGPRVLSEMQVGKQSDLEWLTGPQVMVISVGFDW